MKTVRIVGIVIGSLVLLGIVLVVAVFWIPAIPTAIANRVMNGQEGIAGTIGRVNVDWNGASLSAVEIFPKDGVRWQLEAADVRIAFLPLARGDVRISRLHATGIVADLRRLPEAKADEPAEAFEFDGILRPLREAGLRLWIDDVRVEGRYLLPEAREGTFHLSGGGVEPGTTGELASHTVVTMADDDATGLERVSEQTRIAISQDGTGLTAVAVTSAQLTTEGRVSKIAELRLTENGESYHAALRAPGGGDVAALNATFTYGQDVLAFSYRTQMDESTIEAWGLAGVVPPFSLQGSGEGSVDLAALSGTINGTLNGSVLPPAAEGRAPLPEAGFLFTFAADSDGKTATLGNFALELKLARQAVMQVSIPQPVTIAVDDPIGSLPPDIRLLEIDLSVSLAQLAPEEVAAGRVVGQLVLAKRGQALLLENPRALAIEEFVLLSPDQPPFGPLTLTMTPGATYLDKRLDFRLEAIGGSINGQPFMEGVFGGWALLALEEEASPLRDASLEGDLRIDLAATSDGERATLATFDLEVLVDRQRALSVVVPNALTLIVTPGFTYLDERLDFRLEAIGGSLNGHSFMEGAFGGRAALVEEASPLTDATFEGNLRIDLDTLWGALMSAEVDAGNQGVADVRMRAALPAIGGSGEAELNFRLTGVTANDASAQVEEFSVDLIARLSDANRLAVEGPIRMTGPSGVTELQVSASVVPPEVDADPLRFEAALTGDTIFADDLMLLAAAYMPPEGREEEAPPEEPTPPVSDAPDTEPLWAGIEGSARAEMARIILGDTAITDLLAVLRVDERLIELSEFSAAVAGEPMMAALRLEFTPSPEQPYRFETAFRIKEFNLASLDREMHGEDQPPLLEGIFNVGGQFHGNGPNLETVPQWLQGQFIVEATQATFYPLGGVPFGNTASSVVGQLGGLAAGVLRGRNEGAMLPPFRRSPPFCREWKPSSSPSRRRSVKVSTSVSTGSNC